MDADAVTEGTGAGFGSVAQGDLRRHRLPVVLRDGTPVVIRSICPADRQALRDGFHRLSPDAIYHRFFQTKTELTDAELRYLTELDFRTHLALVVTAEVEGRDQIVAVARFVRVEPPGAVDRAEIAFVVGDEYQHRGIGTLLMAQLAALARQLGYTAFEAEVLPDNHAMLRVFEHSGLPVSERGGDGMIHVTLELSPPVAGTAPRDTRAP
ncbi:MAG: GNAT family N-acetyltransferase [Gemmatimonadales bacterium]|nr:MAG: GNAT family N-acetyltransferase [Gemmatimonadales bacterium]